MAEISRRAGVGMATLYRNFPGRRELLEALYTDEVDAIYEAAESVDAGTPGAVLMAWLHRFFAFATTKHHVASELLQHSDRSNPVFGESRARVLAAGRPGPRRGAPSSSTSRSSTTGSAATRRSGT
jgi:AcrR family transcriptional regulator